MDWKQRKWQINHNEIEEIGLNIKENKNIFYETYLTSLKIQYEMPPLYKNIYILLNIVNDFLLTNTPYTSLTTQKCSGY